MSVMPISSDDFVTAALAAAVRAHKEFWDAATGVDAHTIPLVQVGAMHAALTAYRATAWALKTEADAEFEVRQDGMMVAGASGPRDRALREALHYAQVYGQDGPVELVEIVPIALTKLNLPEGEI